MTEVMDFALNADVSNYVQGIGQAQSSTSSFDSSFKTMLLTAGGAAAVMDKITPKRAHLLGFGLLAKSAADAEAGLSSLAARTAVTGASYDKLTSGIRQLARQMPVGSQAIQATVEQIGQMGVTGAGTERQVIALAKTMTRLAGATGEGVGGLTQGMITLSRASGSLDPKRVERMADSLVTVSAKSGASATSILAFSKSIGPLAQAAGIGQAATIGISSAFARLGEDGVGATNAFNKMVTDLSGAVRDGSPDLAKYANIVGTTTDQFMALYKANPAGAISSVFTALSRNGPNASRQLENIGLDGIRSLRSITAVVNESGGMDKAINTALGSIGNGNNAKASEAAFGGVNAQLVKLRENSVQTGEALGRPLLGPVKTAATSMNQLAGGVRTLVDNPVTKTLMLAAGWGGMALMASRMLTRPLAGYAIARWAATAMPGRALVGGMATGMGRTEGRMAGYATEEMMRRGAAGDFEMDNNRTAGTSRRLFGFGQNLGQRMADIQGTTGRRPGLFRTAGAAASMAFEASTRWTGETYDAASRNMYARRFLFQPDNAKLTDDMKAVREQLRTDLPGAAKNSAKAIKEWVREADRSQAPMERMGTSIARVGGIATRFGATAVRDASTVLGKGISGAAGLVTGPAAAIGVGGYLLQSTLSTGERHRSEMDTFGQRSMFETLNSYRDSLGLAGEQGLSLANSFAEAEKRIVAAVTDMSGAKPITPEEVAAAHAGGRQVTIPRGGTDTQIAAQVRAMRSGTGGQLSPQELQAVQLDLIQQFGQNRAQKISDLVANGKPLTGTAAQSGNINDIIKAATTNTAESGASGRWHQAVTFLLGGGLKTGGAWGGAGSGFDRRVLSKTAKQELDTAFEAIQQNYAENAKNYKPEYAQQELYKQINSAVQTAIGSGDTQVAAESQKRAWKMLTGSSSYKAVDEDKVMMTGDYVAEVAAKNKGFRTGQYATDMATAGFGNLPSIGVDNPMVAQANDPRLGAFGQLFRPVGSGVFPSYAVGEHGGTGNAVLDEQKNPAIAAARNALNTYMTSAEKNPAAEETAIRKMIAGSNAAGQSLDQVAQAAIDLASKHGDLTDAEGQMLLHTRALAISLASNREAYGTPAQQAVGVIRRNAPLIAEAPTPGNQAERTAAVEASHQATDALRNQVIAYLAQVRQRNTQRYRMNRNADLQETRAQQDYNTQRAWSEKAYNLQVGRSNEDFRTQQARALEDFNRSQTQADEDFRTTVLRGRQDFNLQLTRQAEDAAKTLYDPYKRVQTQAVWDANQLIANMGEQAQQLTMQHSNLRRIRGAGVSQNVVDMLGLSKTENAQQLAKLLDDIMADPTVVKRLNATGAIRGKLSKAAVTDPNNVDYRRSLEDFNKGLSRQQSDFDKSMRRSRASYNLQTNRTVTDHQRVMSRMNADHTTELEHATTQFNLALTRMRADLKTSLKDMQTDITDSEQVFTGDITHLTGAMRDVLKTGTTDWGKYTDDGIKSMITSINTNGPDIAAAMNAFLNPLGGGTPGLVAGQSVGPALNSPLHGHPSISQGFGVANSRYASGHHTGIDYAVPVGTPVFAELGGKVITTGVHGAWGNEIVIDHGQGRTTRYAHLSRTLIHQGDLVSSGSEIALSGGKPGAWGAGSSTGAHLHFEADLNGRPVNPSVVPTWGYAGGQYGPNAIAGLMSGVPTPPADHGGSTNFRPPMTWMRAHPASPTANKRMAQEMLAGAGFSVFSMGALDELWTGESGWNQYADNATSSAYGIPQALPGSKMSSAGKDWQVNPATQIRWGLGYIKGRYGTMDRALSFKRANNWYGEGSIFHSPKVIGVGEKGPEAVLPLDQRGMTFMAGVMERYLSGDDARLARTSGHSVVVHYHQDTVTYDHSTTVTGNQIRVVSEDPDHFAALLDAKARRDNLVSSNLGGRRRS